MDQEVEAFLASAKTRAASDPIELPIRDLIERWGATRRSHGVTTRIQRDLGSKGLTTAPSFAEGWIGNQVKLVPVTPSGPSPDSKTENPPEVQTDAEVALRVRALESANRGVCTVPPDASLLYVQSMMLKNDYSQLAVTSGPRALRGAVTWESIAHAQLRSKDVDLRDCVAECEQVNLDDLLLPNIPRIVEAGYVFVRAKDQTLSGIITTSDLSAEFAQLANPFFLLGEVERRLRRAVNRRFSAEQLALARDPKDQARLVTSAEDLSFGEYVRLLESPDNWTVLDLPAERKVFIESLQTVREVRNDVMHFSPDPPSQEQIRDLQNFIEWLRVLDP